MSHETRVLFESATITDGGYSTKKQKTLAVDARKKIVGG